jgi:hypothetical protein
MEQKNYITQTTGVRGKSHPNKAKKSILRTQRKGLDMMTQKNTKFDSHMQRQLLLKAPQIP